MYRDSRPGAASCGVGRAQARSRWTPAQSRAWYDRQPWLIGANYVPAHAANQLDMWQAETFDAEAIDRELGWAAALGMNTMRVFLTDLLWSADADGFAARIDRFLEIAARHRIRPLLVLFDSCWGPEPRLGEQPLPAAGVHNAGWLQSPGEAALADVAQRPRLEAYVRGVIGRFAHDRRILGWDLWNEPCNPGNPHRVNPAVETKVGAVTELLALAFEWARSARPVQPLTSGLWQHDDWRPDAPLTPIERIQLAQSDILSFHDYGGVEQFVRRHDQLSLYGRPVLCTEWLARTAGSTVEAILPEARRRRVAMFNWGLVAGRSQTTYPWDSWVTPYEAAPDRWFHDLLHPDGTPFCAVEAAMIRAFATMEQGRA
jgi:hypothetical protein